MLIVTNTPFLLSVIMLNVVMLESHYAECCYTECRCGECRGAIQATYHFELKKLQNKHLRY
jgi:hypothetical protein